MSGKLVGEVLRYAPSDLTPAQRLTLIALAESARDTDRVARLCSGRLIAEWCGLRETSVHNALSVLAQRALIVPLHIARRGRAQDYRLTELHAHHKASTASLQGEAIEPESLTAE